MSENHHLESVVEKLIHEHFELDESLEEVIWFKSDATPKIRLLEINPDTFATGVVQSFSFPPSDEVPYPLVIAEITPEEWQKVLRNEIPLPEGWRLDNHKVFSREKEEEPFELIAFDLGQEVRADRDEIYAERR
ncbi:MAG: hypothetical protein ACREBU_23400 [Nitrososphaera sp.]